MLLRGMVRFNRLRGVDLEGPRAADIAAQPLRVGCSLGLRNHFLIYLNNAREILVVGFLEIFRGAFLVDIRL
jgi:hypothetical protein